MHIQIIKGKDLGLKDAELIDQSRYEEFGKGKTERHIQAVFDKEIFFLLRDDDERILALGCLEDITLDFRGKAYKIKGIGGIVSIIKGKGYGKILMTAIREYLLENDYTGIGFCIRHNTPFYEKCGFLIAKDSVTRFLQKDDKGNTSTHPDNDDDTLYIESSDHCMQDILRHPEEKVYVPRFR